MKKLIRNIIGFLAAVVVLVIANIEVNAAAAALTGPGTVRAGDTVTLKLQIPDAGKFGLEGTISYDSNQVTLGSAKPAMSGWVVELNGNQLVAYDDKLTTPTVANKTVLTLTFKVKTSVTSGTNLKISVNGLVSTDGNAEKSYGTVTYSVTIAKPLSTVNTLSSLKVGEGGLSPAFSSNTTSYNLGEVDFSVKALTITATATDSKAKVTISGNNLVVGANTVNVVVKAENGSSKTYQIKVTRKQDPNYKASSNANMSQISLNMGTVSPSFAWYLRISDCFKQWQTPVAKMLSALFLHTPHFRENRSLSVCRRHGINFKQRLKSGTCHEISLPVKYRPRF